MYGRYPGKIIEVINLTESFSEKEFCFLVWLIYILFLAVSTNIASCTSMSFIFFIISYKNDESFDPKSEATLLENGTAKVKVTVKVTTFGTVIS